MLVVEQMRMFFQADERPREILLARYCEWGAGRQWPKMTIITACVSQNSHGYFALEENSYAPLWSRTMSSSTPRIGWCRQRTMPTQTLTHCDKHTVQLDTNTVQHSRSTGLDACIVLEANCSLELESKKGGGLPVSRSFPTYF